jgi:hypothetical protein
MDVMNRAEHFYTAGKILSLDLVPSNREKVRELLSDKHFQWTGMVKTGSDNLILPALYLKLQNHDLLDLLPADLAEYLEEILHLNRQRNLNILEQLAYIHRLFLAEGIDFIVMKGVGNIIDPLYSDVGERMVYDIDLLVEEGKMLKAAEVLLNQGFHTQKPFNPSSLDSAMHYPILLREDFVAGVEIHGMAVQYLYQGKFAGTSEIFENSTRSAEGMRLMNPKNRILHNFIHSQLMHSGYYLGMVSLRDLYDLLLLGRGKNLFDIFDDWGFYKEASFGYLRLMYDSFDQHLPDKAKSVSNGRKFVKRTKTMMGLSSPKRKSIYVAVMLFQKYIALPVRIIHNKKARNYVFSRLLDMSWYQRHFAGLKRIFK